MHIITSDNNNDDRVPVMHGTFLTHVYLMTWAKGVCVRHLHNVFF